MREWGESNGCYIDFCKAFNTVSHYTLVDKLMKYGLDSEKACASEVFIIGECDFAAHYVLGLFNISQ